MGPLENQGKAWILNLKYGDTDFRSLVDPGVMKVYIDFDSNH